jgi:CubicO group peptidase (beta-lactamase class C family)
MHGPGFSLPVRRRTTRPLILAVAASLLAALAAIATPAAIAQRAVTPAHGLSADRLARIDRVVEACVEVQCLPGVVVHIQRRGETAYFKGFGFSDVESRTPMRDDTLFRLASMSKAVTTVAVMMLYEEGHFLLNDPVWRYIPEFKGATVLADGPAAGPASTVPAKRAVTIRHLLTHTSGIAYGFIDKRARPVYARAGIPDAFTHEPLTIGETMRKLAALPLLHEPGERFMYGLNTDMLGYLVEVVSGMPLDRFFAERIFTPLGMHDTHFYLPEGKAGRLATLYAERGGRLARWDDGPRDELGGSVTSMYPVDGARTYFSGGAGLTGSTTDYARFLQMLLNGGTLDGTRLLSRKTVELMTVHGLGDVLYSPGYDMGFGFSILADVGRVGELGSAGTFGWSGAFNTWYWVDPAEQMTIIFMSQVRPTTRGDVHRRVRTLAYQAIVD